MKLLLKSDNKTIEFLEGSETINVNDDFVQSITVVAEAPLTAREQLVVVYEDTVSEDTTHYVGLVKSDEGYYALIPQGIINAGGTWTFQIIRRRYSTDGTKYKETASYKYELTVGEGVKNAEGQVVTTAEIMSLYEVVEKQYIRKDGGTMQNPLVVENPRAIDKTTVASDGIHIGTETSEVHYGKGVIVDKYGEAETVYGLPQEGGTLVTEGKARTLAQEEIAKYDFIKIVEALPETGLPNRIYLVPHEAEEGSNDLFDMWVWVNDAWEFEGTKSAEIDNTMYVKFTDYATATKAGVVKATPTFGSMVATDGYIITSKADYTEILAKNSGYKPIVPNTLDYAVKVGITTNAETLTDEEKAAACGWLGAVKKLESTRSSGVPHVYAQSKDGTFLEPVNTTNEGSSIAKRLPNGQLRVSDPANAQDAATKKYVDDNKGTKLYKHTITGFVGGTGIIDIFSITLISTSNAQITSASDLDLQYTQYGISANTAYGKVVNIVQTMTDEITMQFHSRPAGGEVKTVVLDASSITDNVEAL